MLNLAIHPPSRARPGVVLSMPVAARLTTEYNIFGELNHIWAVATLIHKDSGETLYNQLGGNPTDSAHPLPDTGSADRAYFYFPDLVIHEPGRYRIRITLMRMDYSQASSPDGVVTACEYVDTHSITVESGASTRVRPNAQERSFLRVLRDDGQPVPSF
ncbi:hypothetical protein HYFRA_00000504 [Hymenoscyphus fraxineus]|uniref:Velvet domain-containing protein n=1 Tax=Hymenoscyphus fraxineus TaxID=746836 RepID=A0A9N9L298_9HELO|nr:hypothetical protein HYFRA_00000504 [Hymenoscyphus fraxineus]